MTVRRTTYAPGGPRVVFRVRWVEVILTGIVSALVVALVVVGFLIVTEPGVSRIGTLPPCATEDSTGCYWDADTMGNGRGHDVVTLRDGVSDDLKPEGR